MSKSTMPSLVQACLGLGTLLAAHGAQAAALNKSLLGSLAVDGYDVVAYQSDHQAVEGRREFDVEWQGAHWRFASDAHRRAFLAEPQRYAPQYGGYCAFAAAKNQLADIDPQAFTIVDGKLYLNYSKKIQAQWEARRSEFIEQADRNWPQLSQH